MAITLTLVAPIAGYLFYLTYPYRVIPNLFLFAGSVGGSSLIYRAMKNLDRYFLDKYRDIIIVKRVGR
jgi:hypothetical protein